MDRQNFTDLIQTKFKMVRIEAGYTQDTMAQTIGLSTTSDIYWNTVDSRNGFILQSNKVSDIYRVLNQETQPIFGTSKLREAETYFGRISKEELMHV